MNDSRISFDDFQKIHTFPKDLNDLMDLWSHLESTLGSFCGFRSGINNKIGLESAIRGSICSKKEARGGYIGNLRQHKASESAKYSKTNGK